MRVGDTFQTRYNVSTEGNIGDPVMVRYWRVTEVLPTKRDKKGGLIFAPPLTPDKCPFHIHIDAGKAWAVRATQLTARRA
jgi:hypothetical protein